VAFLHAVAQGQTLLRIKESSKQSHPYCDYHCFPVKQVGALVSEDIAKRLVRISSLRYSSIASFRKLNLEDDLD